LQAYHMEADSLRWSDGTGGETLQVITGGEYIVTGINKCGQTHDTILIKQIFCDIWVPNAFTPNGDGVNDELRVLGNTGRLEQFHFYVYNRWGQLVFETTDRSQGWDGRQQGVEAPVGAYVYMLEYKLHGQSILGKGNVTLLR
jgi:gliding motility-associated-like protein